MTLIRDGETVNVWQPEHERHRHKPRQFPVHKVSRTAPPSVGNQLESDRFHALVRHGRLNQLTFFRFDFPAFQRVPTIKKGQVQTGRQQMRRDSDWNRNQIKANAQMIKGDYPDHP